MRILVIDDEMVARIKAEVLLTAYGPVATATDGREAVDLFNRALREGDSFGLVTVDIGLPDLTGQEVVREMRRLEDEHQAEPARILMITARDDMKHMSVCFWEGCQGYVVKPLTPQVLQDALANLYIFPPETP